jgi:hypothetical protein
MAVSLEFNVAFEERQLHFLNMRMQPSPLSRGARAPCLLVPRSAPAVIQESLVLRIPVALSGPW